MGESVVKRLVVQLGAEIDDFEKKFEKATKTLGKQAKKFQEIGETMTKYVTLPLVAAGTLFIATAAQEEKSFHRLGNAAQLAGTQWERARQPVLSYISALQRATEFDEGDISDALSTLTIISGDTQVALDSLQVTLDIAASGLMDLGTASKLVGKAVTGNAEAFKRYGINIAEGAGATAVLEQLTRRFHGSAASALETVTGRFLNLKNKIIDVSETMGGALQPLTMKAMAAVAGLTAKAQAAADWFSRLSPNAKAFAAALAIVVAGAGPALVVFAKLLILGKELHGMLGFVGKGTMTLAGQLLFLVGIALIVVSNWEKTKSLLESIWRGLSMAFLNSLSFMTGILTKFLSVIPGLGDAATKAQAVFDEMATASSVAFTNAAVAIDQGGSWIGNTVETIGGHINTALSHFAAMGTAMDGLGAKPPQIQPKLTAFGEFMKKWAKEMATAAATVAAQITDSFTTMAGSMVSSLAKGTFDGRKMLMDFLVQSLEAVVSWAVKAMIAASGLSAALTAAFSNPFIAVAVIGGLIALVAGLASSFKGETAMASGGMSQGPTRALIGDNPSGEEAVLPLDNPRVGRKLGDFFGSSGGGMTIIQELDGRVISQAAVDYMPGVLRLQGVGV